MTPQRPPQCQSYWGYLEGSQGAPLIEIMLVPIFWKVNVRSGTQWVMLFVVGGGSMSIVIGASETLVVPWGEGPLGVVGVSFDL